MDLKGKVAIITGGAAGIGLCIARRLLEDGVLVALLDVDKKNGEESTKQLQDKFGKEKVAFFSCDVTMKEDFQGAVKDAVDKFSGLDIFINNAGIATSPRWEHVIEVNLMGVMRGVEEATRYMRKGSGDVSGGGRGGVIVNISSLAGLSPIPIAAPYSASKHGVIGFTRCFGDPGLFEATGIRHVVVCPGFTATDLADTAEQTRKVLEHHLKMKITYQKPESVANCVVEVLKNGANGSIWVAENDEPGYEICIPYHSTLRKKE